MTVANNNKPLVSISCITFNHVNYIEDALNGFLMQKTNFNFEVLIHDDASTDGTEEIIREFERKHPSIIKPLYEETNQWVKGRRGSAVFNFPRAQGKYIALCEGDDYWTDPLKLQKQVDFLEGNSEYSLVFTNGKVKYEDNNIEQHLIYRNTLKQKGQYNVFKEPSDTTNINVLANGNYIHTAGVVFVNWMKEEAIPEYMKFVSIGDWPLHMKTATKGLIKYMNEDTFCYRVHATGVYSEKSIIEKYKMTLGQFAPMLNSNIFDPEVKLIIENYCFRSCCNYLKICNESKDIAYFNDFIYSLNKNSENLFKIIIKELLSTNMQTNREYQNLLQSKCFIYKKAIKNLFKIK